MSKDERVHSPDMIIPADHGGEGIRIPEVSRFQGTYILGRPGTGKSNLLGWTIGQDLNKNAGCCLIDPHGELWEQMAHYTDKREDIILLDASYTDYPFGVNVFDCQDVDDPASRAQTISHVLGLFRKLWGEAHGSWGPQLESLLRAVTTLLVDNPGMTITEIPTLLYDDAFRQGLMSNLRSNSMRVWWENEYNAMSTRDKREFRRSTINRITAFVDNPIVANILGQSGTTVDIAAAMDEGMVVLVKLPVDYIGEDAVSLIGSVIVRDILQATLRRATTGVRRPFYLYVDEYQRFATPDFATLLAEARKYNVGVTIAHQSRSQLDENHRMMPLIATNIICFQTLGADAREMADNFDASPPERQVTGERPRRNLVNRPLDYLDRNAAPNPQTADFYDGARTMLDGIGRHFEYEYRDVAEAPADPHRARNRKEVMEDTANQLLYDLMTNPPRSSDGEPIRYPESFEKYIRRLHMTLGWTRDYPRHMVALDSEERRGKIDAAAMYLCLLGMGLAANPIYAPTGQYEPIYETEMAVSNVRDKIANELANLQPYSARVRYRGLNGMDERVIPIPPYPRAEPTRVPYLMQESRKRYFEKHRSQIEAEIEARSTLETPVEVEETKEPPARRQVKIQRREPL